MKLDKMKITSMVAILLSFTVIQGPVFARDTINIVGSSTVYPFSKSFGKRFSQITGFNKPKLESTGSGGGFRLFCEGVGTSFPDITNASRRMKAEELRTCASNGAGEITEVLIGYDGVSVATSALVEKFKFTDKDLYLALAKYVPNSEGKFEKNPYTSWKQINPTFPDVQIKVFGPPPSSGTRDAFSELALGKGAKRYDFLNTLNKIAANEEAKINAIVNRQGIPDEYWNGVKQKKAEKAKGGDLFKALVYDLRDDGVFVETGENDDLIVRELVTNPNAIGIIGYGFLLENSRKIHGSFVNEFEPTSKNISEGNYPLSRGLYFYIKKAHISIVPGIKEFAKGFLSRIEVGKGGYLEKNGLITMDAATYTEVKARTNALENLKL